MNEWRREENTVLFQRILFIFTKFIEGYKGKV